MIFEKFPIRLKKSMHIAFRRRGNRSIAGETLRCASIAFALLAFAGCDDTAFPVSGKQADATIAGPSDRQDAVADEQVTHNRNTDRKTNDQWRENALRATIRLERIDGRGTGSGVILGARSAFTYALTANHVIAGSDRVRIVEYSEATPAKVAAIHPSAQIVAGDFQTDLALVRFVSTGTPPPPLRIAPPPTSEPREPVAIELLATACLADTPPQAWQVNAVGPLLVRRTPGEKPTRYWQITPALEAGSSGGGLFDKSGRIVGIASGASENLGYYGYTDVAREFLKQIDHGWLITTQNP